VEVDRVEVGGRGAEAAADHRLFGQRLAHGAELVTDARCRLEVELGGLLGHAVFQ
jgi:hypothetical protein